MNFCNLFRLGVKNLLKHLLYNQNNAKDYVNKTFSNYKSGIINPEIDINWQEKVDKYIDYICTKREKLNLARISYS